MDYSLLGSDQHPFFFLVNLSYKILHGVCKSRENRQLREPHRLWGHNRDRTQRLHTKDVAVIWVVDQSLCKSRGRGSPMVYRKMKTQENRRTRPDIGLPRSVRWKTSQRNWVPFVCVRIELYVMFVPDGVRRRSVLSPSVVREKRILGFTMYSSTGFLRESVSLGKITWFHPDIQRC